METRMGSYWRVVHRRAFADARRTLGLETGAEIVIRALLFLIYVFLIWRFIGANDARQELLFQILLILPALLIFPIAYIWHMSKIPADINRDSIAQNEALANEIRQLKENKPNFIGQVEEVAWGGQIADMPNRTGATAVLRITNVGSRAGAIPEWSMWVERDGDKRHAALMAGAVSLRHLDGRSYSYIEDDFIAFKTREPIQPGAFVQGFITGVLQPHEQMNEGDRLVISFTDVFGEVHHAEHVFTKTEGRHGVYAGMSRTRLPRT